MPGTIEKIPLKLNVNGKTYVRNVEPRMLLVEFFARGIGPHRHSRWL